MYWLSEFEKTESLQYMKIIIIIIIFFTFFFSFFFMYFAELINKSGLD